MSFLTSLASAFKGGGRQRVPLARSFTSPWAYAFEPPPFEYRQAVARAFVDNPVAQRAVRLVAEGVGSAPLVPADKAALALVQATSAGQALLETLAAQLLLHGNGFVQVMRDGSGKPVELFALRPERVAVVPGDDGWPAAYKYTVGDAVLTLPAEYQAGDWVFIAPRDGLRVLDKVTGQAVLYRDGWNRPATPPEPAGGATVDAEARAAIADLVEVLIASGILAQS